jgi:phenylacetate-CoA ligase
VFGLEILDPEALYRRLPTSLQNVSCSFVGWHNEHTRYAGAFPRILDEAVARTYWTAERIASFRDRRLASIVETCQFIPFYRERIRASGIEASDIRSLKDLEVLPILTKDEVRDHLVKLSRAAVPARKTRPVHTSGTTGAGLRFSTTMLAIQEQWAVWWRYRGWHGIRKGTWCGVFAGRSIVPSTQSDPPFWRVNHFGRQLLFSGYHMSPQNLSAYVAELRRRQPPWLHGYPSLLALLAAYLIDSNTDLGYDVGWVTVGAENLLPHQAAIIKRGLGVRPIQHYGLAEGVANISQCERGSLHVDEDFAAVEFLPTGHDGLHRIVGTNLTNPATPLLRYETQDLATLRRDSSCGCGRPGRVVERVDGRLEDYVVLRNGTRIGRMDHVFKDMVNIKEAQIYQATPGEMTIRVVRGAEYGEADEETLIRETRKRVGGETDVRIEYAQSLPRSETGKLRFVVSDIQGADIQKLPATHL